MTTIPYPSAWTQLRELAVMARAAGKTFDQFWEDAVRPNLPPVRWKRPEDWLPGAVVWANDSKTCQDDRAAVLATRDAWESAYTGGRRLSGERGLAYLASLIEGRERAEAVAASGEAVPSAA